MTILNSPGNLSSVSNEMIFVVEDAKSLDPVTYPNYKYIADVYVDGELKARLRATPDPAYSFGRFDVSVILRDYVPAYGLKANYANVTEEYDINIAYTCKLGEEYGDTLFTNIVTDSERTAYKTYAQRPFLTSDAIGVKLGLSASNYPVASVSKGTAYKTEKWLIVPFIQDSSGSFVNIALQDDDNNTVGSVSYQYLNPFTIFQVNIGFDKISAEMGLSQIQKDSVTKIRYDFDGTPPLSLTYKCSKYTPINLAWLNPYGAYESQSFGLVSKRTNEITRKDYAQLSYQMNSSGVISYDSDGVMYGSKKGYAATTKASMALTSHLLTDAEYTWLADLFSSPDVYFFSDTLDRWVPCTIQDNNYEYRTYKNSRLKTLQFTINYTDSYNSQYL